jgi:hypothetical protein
VLHLECYVPIEREIVHLVIGDPKQTSLCGLYALFCVKLVRSRIACMRIACMRIAQELLHFKRLCTILTRPPVLIVFVRSQTRRLRLEIPLTRSGRRWCSSIAKAAHAEC